MIEVYGMAEVVSMALLWDEQSGLHQIYKTLKESVSSTLYKSNSNLS
jgi:hypothetical protein